LGAKVDGAGLIEKLQDDYVSGTGGGWVRWRVKLRKVFGEKGAGRRDDGMQF